MEIFKEKTKSAQIGSITVCNVQIHDLTVGEAVEKALDGINRICFAVTPNAVMLDGCRRDPTLCALLNHATISLADGAGVLLAARRKGTPLRERAAGIEFGEALLSRAAREGLRVFLLGGGEGVAVRAAERLCAQYPGLCIAGTYWGYFEKTGEEDRRVTEIIRATRPDILFVCFGFPAQERWIDAHLDRLDGVRVAAGLGGALDVWAGDIKRAPVVLSHMGLEWAWRMLREPKRLKKLPALVRFAVGRNGRG